MKVNLESVRLPGAGHLFRLIIVVAFVMSACSSSGDDSESSAADESTDTTTSSDASTTTVAGPPPTLPAREPQVFTTIDGEVEEVVLPIDLLAAVEEGVELGTWSEVEGIVRALDGISGRNPPTPGLSIDDVEEPGITALARTAGDLLAGGSLSEEDAAELEEAFAFFTPSQEVLDAISDPSGRELSAEQVEGTAVGRPGPASVRQARSALALPVRAGQADGCETVTGMGFPTLYASGSACYVYDEWSANSDRLRVYYPKTWLEDEARLATVDNAFNALWTSNIVYADFATVGDINAVFSMGNDPTALAAQNYFDLAEPCPITIYPSASNNGADVFKQTIAHEVFHCVEDRTFSLTKPYATHSWWLEGAAEFFSNVVYPSVNDEHSRTSTFDRNSPTMNLTQMAYETTVFFQYFANIRGVETTIDLLDTIASGGATVDTVASVDGMAELWQDFVVAFVADAVLDSGGGTVGGANLVIDRPPITGEGQVDYDTTPLVATRYKMDYEQGKRFAQSPGGDTRYAVAERAQIRNLSAWTTLPEEILAPCDEQGRYVLVTTTVEEQQTFTTTVDEVEEGECDPCLLGPWQMQLSSFESYMQGVFASIGAPISGFTFDIGGAYYFDFDGSGELRTERQGLTIGVGAPGLEVPGLGAAPGPVAAINGTQSGRYTTDGETLTVSGLEGAADVAAGLPGSVASGVEGIVMSPSGGSAPYECDENTLTINDTYGTLVFDRIEQIPEPESVDVETGTPAG